MAGPPLNFSSSRFSRPKLRPESQGFLCTPVAPGRNLLYVLCTKEIIRLKHLPSRGFLLIPLPLQLQVPLEEVREYGAGLQQGKCCFHRGCPGPFRQRTASLPLSSLPSQRATNETQLASHPLHLCYCHFRAGRQCQRLPDNTGLLVC